MGNGQPVLNGEVLVCKLRVAMDMGGGDSYRTADMLRTIVLSETAKMARLGYGCFTMI